MRVVVEQRADGRCTAEVGCPDGAEVAVADIEEDFGDATGWQ